MPACQVSPANALDEPGRSIETHRRLLILITTFESLDECFFGISALCLLSKVRQKLIYRRAALEHGHGQPGVKARRNARTVVRLKVSSGRLIFLGHRVNVGDDEEHSVDTFEGQLYDGRFIAHSSYPVQLIPSLCSILNTRRPYCRKIIMIIKVAACYRRAAEAEPGTPGCCPPLTTSFESRRSRRLRTAIHPLGTKMACRRVDFREHQSRRAAVSAWPGRAPWPIAAAAR